MVERSGYAGASFHGLVGVAASDVTPPVGIYHRMWGAALHDRATAIHRPLTATALWMQSGTERDDLGAAQLILALDHCIIERTETDRLRAAASKATMLDPQRVAVCLSHTHGAGWLSRSRAHLPGGELIGPYLDELVVRCERLAAEAQQRATLGWIVGGSGHCNLAAHRDYFDSGNDRYVCGFNPAGPADDTIVAARLVTDSGTTLGTLVNYACHPTTLAWQNMKISPDYVGALREVVEAHTGAPCIFLQGASGDLGPREGFVGDTEVADRNGRQLGYAVLAVLEGLPQPGTKFVYSGPVVSGATLGTWRHEPLDAPAREALATWRWRQLTLPLAYRDDLPTLDDTRRELSHWQAEEEQARAIGDEARLRRCRAGAEQMTRQLARLSSLPAGDSYPFTLTVGRTGEILWLIVPAESYQVLQTELRGCFPHNALFVVTNANDWQPGYLPTADVYGRGIYQEQIAVVAAGSLERVIERAACELQSL
jgi:hypothetical protein